MFNVEKTKENLADPPETEPSVNAKREVEKLDRMKPLNRDSTRVQRGYVNSLGEFREDMTKQKVLNKD